MLLFLYYFYIIIFVSLRHNQTIIIQECTKYIDDQKARIKELEKYKQPEYEKAILQQARADQNKKIGDWLAKTVGNGAKVSFTQEFIAKLQKGEF